MNCGQFMGAANPTKGKEVYNGRSGQGIVGAVDAQLRTRACVIGLPFTGVKGAAAIIRCASRD